MRLRKKPGTIEKIHLEKDYFVINPQDYFGKWREAFTTSQPLVLEIGMGAGRFSTAKAADNRNLNYIGIEKQEELIKQAIQKSHILNLNNIKFLWINADVLETVFSENEVSHLHLNFSDPWPKNKHAKRRLTHRNYLNKYRHIIQPGGLLEVKTDNSALFEFTLNELLNQQWQINNVTFDLHEKVYFDGYMTEYEERFNSKGEKIYYLQASNNK